MNVALKWSSLRGREKSATVRTQTNRLNSMQSETNEPSASCDTKCSHLRQRNTRITLIPVHVMGPIQRHGNTLLWHSVSIGGLLASRGNRGSDANQRTLQRFKATFLSISSALLRWHSVAQWLVLVLFRETMIKIMQTPTVSYGLIP